MVSIINLGNVVYHNGDFTRIPMVQIICLDYGCLHYKDQI